MTDLRSGAADVGAHLSIRAPAQCIIGMLCAVMLFGASAAADQRLIAEGEDLAKTQCGQCHAVGLFDESPHPITPPFRDLHQDFPIPMLVDALATGVVSGHDEMPMFEFTREEAGALLAYIDSLHPDKPSYRQNASQNVKPTEKK
jgi:mono/diheme cytochrome c family protein